LARTHAASLERHSSIALLITLCFMSAQTAIRCCFISSTSCRLLWSGKRSPASAPIVDWIQIWEIWRPEFWSDEVWRFTAACVAAESCRVPGVQGHCLAGIQNNHQTCDGLQVTSVVSAGCHDNSQPSPRVPRRTDRSTPVKKSLLTSPKLQK